MGRAENIVFLAVARSSVDTSGPLLQGDIVREQERDLPLDKRVLATQVLQLGPGNRAAERLALDLGFAKRTNEAGRVQGVVVQIITPRGLPSSSRSNNSWNRSRSITG
jgi:hypothetical protein